MQRGAVLQSKASGPGWDQIRAPGHQITTADRSKDHDQILRLAAAGQVGEHEHVVDTVGQAGAGCGREGGGGKG